MKNIFVAGHNGMVGSAIVRKLETMANVNIITKSRAQLDLLDVTAVNRFFSSNCIHDVYLAAAKVGGIGANSNFPAEFIYENLTIQNNVIQAAYKNNVDRLLLLGSSCIYPKYASQPMTESELLTGTLEPTNNAYAIAKIAGIKMCESYNIQYGTDFRSIMPTNLYGPGDNFAEHQSHVIPALIKRFHEAKSQGAEEVVIWGTGKPIREFLHVDDLAIASIYFLTMDKEKLNKFTKPTLSHVNIGTGKEITIAELATEIKTAVGYEGNISFDRSKPDGMERKVLDCTVANKLGWTSKINFDHGVREAYQWYKDNYLIARQ